MVDSLVRSPSKLGMEPTAWGWWTSLFTTGYGVFARFHVRKWHFLTSFFSTEDFAAHRSRVESQSRGSHSWSTPKACHCLRGVSWKGGSPVVTTVSSHGLLNGLGVPWLRKPPNAGWKWSWEGARWMIPAKVWPGRWVTKNLELKGAGLQLAKVYSLWLNRWINFWKAGEGEESGVKLRIFQAVGSVESGKLNDL